MRGVVDAGVSSRRPRPDPSRREGEEDATEKRAASACPGELQMRLIVGDGERLGLGFRLQKKGESSAACSSYPPGGRSEGGSRGMTRRRHGHGASAEHCGDMDGGGFLENPLPPFFFSIFLLNF